MAYPVEVTLATGNKVSLNYQSQEVSVSITYQLENDDSDMLDVVQDKTRELVAAHELAWKGVKGEINRVEARERAGQEAAKTENEQQAMASPRSCTLAQVNLIRALWHQRGNDEEELGPQLQSAYGCGAVEELSFEQAAEWLITFGQEERGRFERTRFRSIKPQCEESDS